MAEAKQNDIPLKNMLVVVICIENYPEDEKAGDNDLPGTQVDKASLVSLFGGQYKYKVMRNGKSSCTVKEMRKLLKAARVEFQSSKYDGIMVFFSGHGTSKYLECTDKKFKREEFETFFNGHNCPQQHKLGKYKFYFVDACSGKLDGKKVEPKKPKKVRGDDEYKPEDHPEWNRCILEASPSYYMANSSTEEDEDGNIIYLGSDLTRAIVHVFTENLKQAMGFTDLLWAIQQKAASYGFDDDVNLPQPRPLMDPNEQKMIKFYVNK